MTAKTDGSYGNTLGQVEHCDCGGVNVVIGPMTLHFARDETIALGELLDAARRMVRADADPVTPNRPPARPTGGGILH